MGLVVVRRGRMDCMISGQRKPMNARETKWDHEAQVHLDGSRDCQAGGLDCMSSDQGQPKESQ